MNYQLNLSSTLLERLYTKKHLSTYKIASILKCDPKTIYRYLKKYKIKTRSIKKPEINTNDLKNLYENQKMSLFNISKIYKMTPSGILKRMKKSKIPMRSSWEANTSKKYSFTGSLKEKAYLIGFRLGDLGVRKSSKKTNYVKVGSNTTKEDQAVLIRDLFRKYAKVWVSKNKKGVFSVSTILDPSFSFLLGKQDKIINWILLSNYNMRAFIAGYVDAEGSFGIYRNRAKFRLGSYDRHILGQIDLWLQKNKIKSIFKLERSKRLGQNNDFWRITINEAISISRLYQLIYPNLRHPKRKSDFDKVMGNVRLRLKNGTIHI